MPGHRGILHLQSQRTRTRTRTHHRAGGPLQQRRRRKIERCTPYGRCTCFMKVGLRVQLVAEVSLHQVAAFHSHYARLRLCHTG